MYFTHSDNGSTNEDDQVITFGLQTTGTAMVTYTTTVGNNQMQIYYGTTNVAAGTGVLLYDSGMVTFTTPTNFSLPFGPTNGLTTNILTIVMNIGGATTYNPWSYTISKPGQTQNLMIGGSFSVAGQTYGNLARLNTDGSLDTTFNPSTGPDNSVLALGWQADNRIVVGGTFKNVNGLAYNKLARMNYNGTVDSSFFVGTGPDNQVNSITLQPVPADIYVGGPFTTMNGTHRLGFARLNPDGTVDTSFLDTAYNQLAGLPRQRFIDAHGSVNGSGLQSDGNVIVVGSFSQVGGGQFDPLVRFH